MIYFTGCLYKMNTCSRRKVFNLRHTGQMAHDDIYGLNGVQGYLLISPLERLIQGIEAHLGDIFDSHMENPIPTFTRQGHFKLNLEIQTQIKLILTITSSHHWSHR